MKDLICLFASVLLALFSFGQTPQASSSPWDNPVLEEMIGIPKRPDLPVQLEVSPSASQKTAYYTTGYTTSTHFLWNEFTLQWDSISRYENTWDLDQIVTQIVYEWQMFNLVKVGSTEVTYTPNQRKVEHFEWDGTSYTPYSEWDIHTDSLNNQTLEFSRYFINGTWDTTINYYYQYSYSGNANYDSLLIWDLTKPAGMQQEFREYRSWNSSGTEPDSIISLGYINGQWTVWSKLYDITWNDFSQYRYDKATFDWEIYTLIDQRRTNNWGANGILDAYEESKDPQTGQWDSTSWRHYEYHTSGCQSLYENYFYDSTGWKYDDGNLNQYTLDANNRIIRRDLLEYDPVTMSMVPYIRSEYEFPLVGTTPVTVPDFEVTVFPNPGNSPLQLNINAASPIKMELQLVDLTGKLVLEDSWSQPKGESQKSFAVDLASGTYLYRIQTEKGSVTGKYFRY